MNSVHRIWWPIEISYHCSPVLCFIASSCTEFSLSGDSGKQSYRTIFSGVSQTRRGRKPMRWKGRENEGELKRLVAVLKATQIQYRRSNSFWLADSVAEYRQLLFQHCSDNISRNSLQLVIEVVCTLQSVPLFLKVQIWLHWLFG